MLLSVIMTNFNHGHFLEARLSSILDQLTENGEIVIVDDASTDESVSIIKTFAAKDKRIKLLQNSTNLGVIPSVNRALQTAQGKYITSLAADDLILPGFIKKTLQPLLDHPDIAICCSDCGLLFDCFPDRDTNH